MFVPNAYGPRPPRLSCPSSRAYTLGLIGATPVRNDLVSCSSLTKEVGWVGWWIQICANGTRREGASLTHRITPANPDKIISPAIAAPAMAPSESFFLVLSMPAVLLAMSTAAAPDACGGGAAAGVGVEGNVAISAARGGRRYCVVVGRGRCGPGSAWGKPFTDG